MRFTASKAADAADNRYPASAIRMVAPASGCASSVLTGLQQPTGSFGARRLAREHIEFAAQPRSLNRKLGLGPAGIVCSALIGRRSFAMRRTDGRVIGLTSALDSNRSLRQKFEMTSKRIFGGQGKSAESRELRRNKAPQRLCWQQN
ncbi:hypothetical protein [Pseudorhodoplanes sp.]|uniref:hypothetical protein n=1 Tax=Pseudorhodoplanes sp. TaxID=1934341 RepID=UPI002D7F6146|nr:hypothetical protein [Pseudorhodoplanes sp.]